MHAWIATHQRSICRTTGTPGPVGSGARVQSNKKSRAPVDGKPAPHPHPYHSAARNTMQAPAGALPRAGVRTATRPGAALPFRGRSRRGTAPAAVLASGAASYGACSAMGRPGAARRAAPACGARVSRPAPRNRTVAVRAVFEKFSERSIKAVMISQQQAKELGASEVRRDPAHGGGRAGAADATHWGGGARPRSARAPGRARASALAPHAARRIAMRLRRGSDRPSPTATLHTPAWLTASPRGCSRHCAAILRRRPPLPAHPLPRPPPAGVHRARAARPGGRGRGLQARLPEQRHYPRARARRGRGARRPPQGARGRRPAALQPRGPQDLRGRDQCEARGRGHIVGAGAAHAHSARRTSGHACMHACTQRACMHAIGRTPTLPLKPHSCRNASAPLCHTSARSTSCWPC